MGIKLKGLDKALTEFNKRLDSTPTQNAIREVCLDLHNKSANRAPIDTGALRASAYSEVKGLRGEVGFGELYALVQHERLDFDHPKGGEAKYLENPLKENTARYMERIKGSGKTIIEGG